MQKICKIKIYFLFSDLLLYVYNYQINIIVNMNNLKARFANVITLVEKGETGKGSLYIGNLMSANSHDVLTKYDINSIVTLCQDEPRAIEDHESVSAHYYYPIYDHPSQMINFDTFQRLADVVNSDLRDGRNVLVHCYAGRSRSSTFILFYQMTLNKYADKSLKDLLIGLHNIHPLTAPNRGFVKQLAGWEKEHRKSIHEVVPQGLTPTIKLADSSDSATSQVTVLGGMENLYPIRQENLEDFVRFKPSYMQDREGLNTPYDKYAEQDDWLKSNVIMTNDSSHGARTITHTAGDVN